MEEADPGSSEAFCPLLWEANGGNVTEDGKPSHTNWPVRGKCKEPDCGRCELMQNILVNLAANGISSLWICPACVGVVRKEAEEIGVIIKLPGFFADGLCQRPKCHRVDRFSEILQLLTVIGPTIP